MLILGSFEAIMIAYEFSKILITQDKVMESVLMPEVIDGRTSSLDYFQNYQTVRTVGWSSAGFKEFYCI